MKTNYQHERGKKVLLTTIHIS
jgi:hypothetical protein